MHSFLFLSLSLFFFSIVSRSLRFVEFHVEKNDGTRDSSLKNVPRNSTAFFSYLFFFFLFLTSLFFVHPSSTLFIGRSLPSFPLFATNGISEKQLRTLLRVGFYEASLLPLLEVEDCRDYFQHSLQLQKYASRNCTSLFTLAFSSTLLSCSLFRYSCSLVATKHKREETG